MDKGDRLVLLTGSTGYVGGRLLKQLESLRGPLRCLARRPEYFASASCPTPKSSAVTSSMRHR